MYRKLLLTIRRHEHLRSQHSTRTFGDSGHHEWDSNRAAGEQRAAYLQPLLVAGGRRVNGPILFGPDDESMLKPVADFASELNAALTDVNLGRRRQAESLKELLDGSQPRSRRPLDRVGPAVLLKPLDHRAFLEQERRLLRGFLAPLGDLARRGGAGQDP